MWPKMLLELLPHLSRLVPMWDKFLSSRAASDKATENAINALSQQVANDLGQVTSAHSGLYRQLQDHSAQIAALNEDLRLTRQAAERAEAAAQRLNQGIVFLAADLKRIFAAVVAIGVLLGLSVVLQLVLHFNH